jgi:hypothetical protein
MRSKRFRLSMLLAFGALTVMTITGVMCQKQKSAENETAGAGSIAKMPAADSMMTGGGTITADTTPGSPLTGYYTCPMHPQVHQSQKDKCPFCGMSLVFKNSSIKPHMTK